MNDPYKLPEAKLEIENAHAQDTTELVLASRGLRFGGALIDGALVGIPAVFAAYYFGFYENITPDGRMPFADQMISMLIGISIMILLNGYLIYRRGQTIGKLICGARVVTLEGKQVSGNNYVFLRLAPMWIMSQIPVVGAFVGLIDSLLIFRKDHNCLHDDIAKTRVVKS